MLAMSFSAYEPGAGTVPSRLIAPAEWSRWNVSLRPPRATVLVHYGAARILHPWPQQRFAVKYPRWEPSARMGPARLCAGGAQ